MKYLLRIVCICIVFCSCDQEQEVAVRGRIESRDSVVIFRLNGEEYSFTINENRQFSGEIEIEECAYAVFHLPHSQRWLNLFLVPGKDIEISLTAYRDPPVFHGALAAINTYLSEEWNRGRLPHTLFRKEEQEFVDAVLEEIQSRILMLEAKNFGEEFNIMERDRIRYYLAEQATYYPFYQRGEKDESAYAPGEVFTRFIEDLREDNPMLMKLDSYRKFLIRSYYAERNASIYQQINDITHRFQGQEIKDFLLSSIVSAYIYRNGPEDTDYLLFLCEREIKDPRQMQKIEEVADLWRRLAPGCTAPEILMVDMSGESVKLSALRGSFLYLGIDGAYLKTPGKDIEVMDSLANCYDGKNIRFATIALGSGTSIGATVDHQKRKTAVLNYFVSDTEKLFSDYIISTLPRFIFIDPQGCIIQANATAPTQNIKFLFSKVGL